MDSKTFVKHPGTVQISLKRISSVTHNYYASGFNKKALVVTSVSAYFKARRRNIL